MDYATAYDVGERKRGEGLNEDSVAMLAFEEGHRDGYEGRDVDGHPANRSVGVFALADGAGGYDAGDVASYIASSIVVEELASLAVRAARSDPAAFDVDIESPVPDSSSAAGLQRAIDDAIQVAHRNVLRYASESGEAALTTIVAGIAIDGELHYGWVGDSRAYLCNRVHETMERITKDHSVVTELADAGEIDDVEAHVHPRGNEITNALGGHPEEAAADATVPVETHTVPLYAEDVVLVTSDGLIDAQTDAPHLHQQYVAAERDEETAEDVLEAVVTDGEIRDLVLGGESLEGAASALVDLANDRGGKDNVSVLLFQDRGLRETPETAAMPIRAIDPDEPVEDRQTVIVPDE